MVDMALAEAQYTACYSSQLLFLVAKRIVVLMLMGCEVQSVDTRFKQSTSDSRAVNAANSQMRAQAQATNSANRFVLSHGESKYDELSKSKVRGTVDRHAVSNEKGDGLSTFRDDSRGSGYNNSNSVRNTIGLGVWDHLTVENERQRLDMARTDCNFESSYQRQAGVADVVGFGLFQFGTIVSGDGKTAQGEWRKYIRRNENRLHTITATSTISGNQFRETNTLGNSTHKWQSLFFTDTQTDAVDYDVRTAHDRSDSRRHSEAQAQGLGNGLSEAKIEGNSSAQGTTLSEANANRDQSHIATSNSTGYTLANSQRFSNLRMLYDQLSQRIDLIRRRIKMRSIPLIGELSCHSLPTCSVTALSRLLHAGMQACESTCSESWTNSASYQ